MPSLRSGITSGLGLCICPHRNISQLVRRYYCLTACLYAKCCNLIGWIIECGPSIHFRIDGPDHSYVFRSKLKHRIFGKMVDGRETIDRGREKLVTFGKLSVNFPEKTETIDYYIFSKVFHQFTLGTNFRSLQVACSEIFSQAINSLITGWTVSTKNINPSVLPAVGLYVRTSGFIFFCIDSPTSY